MHLSIRGRRRKTFRPDCDRLERRQMLDAGASFISQLPIAPSASFSTVPANGDLNPYGVAFVPKGFAEGGPLAPGDVLVSNFNSSANNFQGTGTTLVSVNPATGSKSVFFTSPQPGLDTALGVLKRGFVIVGNVPTTDGTFNTIGQGSLQILNRYGQLVTTLSDPKLLDGPWDLTVNDRGNTAQVFVSDVLDGAVTRIDLTVPERGNGIVVRDMIQIASGYSTHADPAAVVVGPTGLAFNPHTNTLYVASTADNEIFAVRNAGTTMKSMGTGSIVYQDPTHLHGPLGLAFAPDGNLLTANGDAPTVNPDPNQPSEIVEFTPNGQFVGQISIDPAEGAAFGLAVEKTGKAATLATVNDDLNTVDLRTVAPIADHGIIRKAPHFYEHYIGPKLASLNVTAADVRFEPGRGLVLFGQMQGAIDTSPVSTAQQEFYVFGFNRGGSKEIAPFYMRPGIRFDSVVIVSITPAGGITGSVVDFVNNTKTSLPPGSIQIEGRQLFVTINPALLPMIPGGVSLNKYEFNLWPRSSLNNAGMGQYVASFIPEFGMAPIFVPQGDRG